MLALTVTFHSDWHIGSGSGRHGMVDRVVQRDGSGLPFVPGKTMAGVWRDACEVAARALDGDPSGVPRGGWQGWLEFVFGSQPSLAGPHNMPAGRERPRPAALQIGSLHYPEPVAAALLSRPLVREAVTFLKPGVRLEARSGRAAPNMLRWVEMARPQAVLLGTGTIAGYDRLTEDQQRCVAALLLAGARLVDRIGGKRRRGAGRCAVAVSGLELDVDWLRHLQIPPPAPTWPAVEDDLPLPSGTGQPAEWEIARLRLRLDRPVVVQERTVGNTIRSAAFVPGRMLLPIVLARLDVPAAPEAARAGDLVITDATVEVAGVPGRPAPLPLELGGGWYVGNRVTDRWLVPRTERTHNTVDDSSQRPTREVGGVFTYQAIAAGTVLCAQVRAPVGLLPAGWPDRLAGTWRLGRSRKDDYGQATVTVTRGHAPEDWFGGLDRLRIWLLSDLLITDQWLRPAGTPTGVADELGRALGVKLRPAADRFATASYQTSRVDSWHGRWGLPRPSQVGLSAGSVLDFAVVEGTVTPEAIGRLHVHGLGLRRAEGFGQVRVNDPAVAQLSTSPAPVAVAQAPDRQADSPSPLSTVDQRLVGVIERSAWMSELHRRSEALAATAEGRALVLGAGHEAVPRAQLGGLRMIAAQLDEMPTAQIIGWLVGLAATERRDQSWPKPVQAQLRRLLTDRDQVWNTLAMPEDDLVVAADRRAALRAELWPVAVRTLVTDSLTALDRAVAGR